jgi:Ca-activated chloride channel family protein
MTFREKKKALARFASPELLSKMTATASHARQYLKAFLLILGIAFMIIALARPQIGTKLETIKRKGIDIIFAIDTSKSMLAEDIKPNRLQKAKMEIANLIKKLEGDRVGLIAFAGDAFVHCPLTLDYGACKLFLDTIDTNIIPVPGTAIGTAIKTAINAFNKKERKFKVLILLTDGEDHEGKAVEIAKEAAKEGIKIYTIGVGSPQGEPIPIYDAFGQIIGHRKDRDGQIVVSKLDEVTLKKIALETGGKYNRATAGEMELDKIYKDICKMEKKELIAKKYAQYEDRFQYLLLLALFCISLEAILTDRRRSKKIWRGRFE